MSNAFLRSRNTALTHGDLSSRHLVFSMNIQFADSVEWCALKPNCIGCSGVRPPSRYAISWFATHFSAILEIIGSILIGL